MTEDSDGREFAKWLNEHPTEAQELHASIRLMVEQYQPAVSALDYIREQLAEVAQKAAETIRLTFSAPGVLEKFQEVMREVLPDNWQPDMPNLERAEEVLATDGIPIVHIPRSEIVHAIVDAADYEARMQIIAEQADLIIEDCRVALFQDNHESMGKQVPLARQAVETYIAGFFESAQALAVSVCDTYLKQLFLNPGKRGIGYGTMAKELSIDASEEAGIDFGLNFYYALAPVGVFLTSWFPGDAGEPPAKLSRHVSIHNASTDHMHKSNATLAIMLLASMTVAISYARTNYGSSS